MSVKSAMVPGLLALKSVCPPFSWGSIDEACFLRQLRIASPGVFRTSLKGAVAVAQKMPRTAPRENGRFPRYFTRRRYDGISPWSP